jgi:hypothetical protein
MTTPAQTLDAKMYELVNSWLNLSVPWFLMTSWLYYTKHVSIISDEAFDWLCKTMHDRWDEITHRHKQYITKEDVAAGTGYAINWKIVPEIVFGAATQLAERGEAGLE